MADKKISELVDGGNIISGDYTIITRNNLNYKVDLNNLVNTAIDWSGITNTPTTLSGYGITDSYTINEVDNLISGVTYHPLILLTYAELYNLYNTEQLIPDQKYLITNFSTIHNMLDGSSTTGGVNTSDDEPLILWATSINSFDKQAYSIKYPKDIIHYDITGGDTRDVAYFDAGVAITNLKGVITYRKDTIQNVETWYDFRNVKFRRWLVSATDWVASNSYNINDVYEYNSILYKCKKNHTGITTTPDADSTNWFKWLDKTHNWSWTSDKAQFNIGNINSATLTMSNSIDVYTFGDYYKWVNSVSIGLINLDYIIDNYGYSSRLNNIVFNTINSFYTCYSNTFGENCFNNTIGNNFYTNTIGNNFQSNTIGDSFQSNDFKYCPNTIDFTTATHIYSDYYCEIIKTSNSIFQLNYTDQFGDKVITEITE